MDKVLAVFKEGLSLWKTHLERRKEAYEVKLDKAQNKALNYAEEGFSMTRNLLDYLINSAELNDKDTKYIKEFKVGITKLEKKFNKYD